MRCTDCDKSCYCPAGNPPCGFCTDHAECIYCGAITCEIIAHPSDPADRQPVCGNCQNDEKPKFKEENPMTNYICLNGTQIPLTEEQIKIATAATKPDTSPELEALIEAVRGGNAREQYKIRDVITVDGWDYEIIGFDHDKAADDPDAPTVTLMAKTLTTPRRWHNEACERGWIDADIREWLNDNFINEFPDKLVRHIRATTKKTHNYKGDVYETTDRLFIPAESELFGSAIYSDYEDGPRYEAFSTSETRVRTGEDGDTYWYWTRSQLGESWGGGATTVAHVGSGGAAGYYYAAHTLPRAPVCFIIA